MTRSALASRLLRWFERHKRDLPWRREPRDPYHVWLSEVMLQQTQVATVIPYFERWTQRFPTLETLAAAPLDEVLKLWEGLGYYARARNLHAAARIIVHERRGQLPRTVEGLMALPGVGRYTAGAIASLAFGARAPVLDGNVRRVLSRIFGLARPTEAELWTLAESLLPRRRAGAFNEALMDLGATICTPRAPRCSACPLRALCKAYAGGHPEAYPSKPAKQQTPHREATTVVLVDGAGRALLGQRPRHGLLGGLWEFISAPRAPAGAAARHRSCPPTDLHPSDLTDLIAHKTGLRVKATQAEQLGIVKHAFTHFKLTRRVWLVRLPMPGRTPPRTNGYDRLIWATPAEVERLALTRSDRRIWEMYRARRPTLFD
ncbi:MAG: A/G-specific adenine glycosylase [Chloroflexi bacterium]|jgi:A/G-specific adenine glycosylase|uniref:Adenine DNA glycosylase n=1 Tax=Candidatus Thermofonsia Clade 3 bacterium TaxID=2364212 RepID=A0A2M8QAS2_9CHLR|nr:A/G-specific adenine glycosylase [Candidatus Roseilinea sp. NK_OTU-006]PJF46906.1 MAG: A/G-specific adenine glycosylase [Candidatus Thermofonsia Clade 3 bacterium]RMG64799.1 MAG: A/G-specific adenine glycosylase [Chloroflexota bacterium]